MTTNETKTSPVPVSRLIGLKMPIDMYHSGLALAAESGRSIQAEINAACAKAWGQSVVLRRQGRNTRKSRKECPDKIVELLGTKPDSQIARQVECSRKTVSRWRTERGIPRYSAASARKLGSSPKNRPIRGKQLAVLKLLTTKLKQEEIAERVKCSRSFVSLVWQRHKQR